LNWVRAMPWFSLNCWACAPEQMNTERISLANARLTEILIGKYTF